MRLSITSALLVLIYSSASYSDPRKVCEIPGDPLQWQAAYCMYVAETDDFASPDVTKCVNEEADGHNKDKNLNCEDVIHYKLEICKILISESSYKKDQNTCLHDKEVLPFNVANENVER